VSIENFDNATPSDVEPDDDTGDVDELTIIRSVLRQLDKLDAPAAVRAVRYIADRKGLTRVCGIDVRD
jgi:hypothetical protein